jgi:hypothetical protein
MRDAINSASGTPNFKRTERNRLIKFAASQTKQVKVFRVRAMGPLIKVRDAKMAMEKMAKTKLATLTSSVKSMTVFLGKMILINTTSSS